MKNANYIVFWFSNILKSTYVVYFLKISQRWVCRLLKTSNLLRKDMYVHQKAKMGKIGKI